MNKPVFWVIISLILFSCKRGENFKNEIPKNSIEFDSLKDIEIPLSKSASNFFMLSQEALISNEEYLVYCNPFPNDPNLIFFSNLKDSTQSFTLDFETEGPNGVGEMSDFFIYNLDSIFIFDRYAYQISLVDSSGNVKQKFRLKKSEGVDTDDDSVIPWLDNKSKALLKDGFLYIPSVPDVDPFYQNYNNNNLLIKLDLNSGDFELMLSYPNKYKQGGFWGGPDHMIPSIASSLDSNGFVISFPVVDSIFYFDPAVQTLNQKSLAKSDLVTNVSPLSQFSTDREIRLRFQLGNDFYFSIIPDFYRKRYYRIVNEKYSDQSIENMLKREPGFPIRQSLLVLNERFEMIAEYSLPENFSRYGFFVFKSGLYILNKENENKLVLRHISLL